MVSDKMLEALNTQINAELYSAYLYLAMAAHFDDLNLPGFANWMKVQDQEEKAHATIFYNYVVERGKRVRMKAIAEPPGEWGSPLDVYRAVYDHARALVAHQYSSPLIQAGSSEGERAHCEGSWIYRDFRGMGLDR